jgi:hypothetical protein
MRIRLAVAALVLAAIAASGASTAGGAAKACPSLQNVVGFQGVVSLSVGAAASGGVGNYPGTETIQLASAVTQTRLHLFAKHHFGPIYSFNGPSTGGRVEVADSFDDTADDYHGDLKHDGPPTGRPAGLVIINFVTCLYKVAFGGGTGAEYTGDPEIDPGPTVTFGADSADKALPEDLKLHGSDSPDTTPDCDLSDILSTPSCSYLGGGWLTDLVELILCGNSDPGADVTCKPDAVGLNLGTPAQFSWSLTPVFKKGKKK